MSLKKLKPKYILIFILLLTALLRLYRLDYPNKYIFDEVYHVFTAKEYLLGHKEAWEWWTSPPPGVAYEWTHPPLAKEIMAASMYVTGSTDGWAWRIPGTILGVVSVYLVYLLGRKLFKKENPSLIAAFIFSIDGLNFVQSRTGMNDIYFVTFMLISIFFFLENKYLFSALSLGLCLSSKWAGVYTYLLFLPLLLKDRKWKQVIYFIVIPPIVYFLTYIPFFILGHNIDQFISLHQQMWWYHTSLKATHGYSSAWWSWPLNLYPVWYFVDYQKNTIANIFASGNPAVFWAGTATVILTAVEMIKRKSFSLLFTILGFLIFWLPWATSPRIMFLYHFSPSVPFLSLALGHQLNTGLADPKSRRLVIILLGLMVLSFILIYPFLIGIPIPKGFIKLFFLTNLTKDPF